MGSDLRLNIRFIYWHLQITDCWKWSWLYNDHHKITKLSNGWFKVYDFDLFKTVDCGCGGGESANVKSNK